MKKYVIPIIILLIIICVVIIFMNMNNNKNDEEEIDTDTLITYKYNTEEINIKNSNNENIYGVLYKPIREDKMPIVIYSHGLGANYSYGTDYAEKLAELGIATYCFDFRGGSAGSKSDGKTTEMSVITETEDLKVILKNVENWNFIDKDKIILLGTSQGGAVSALVSSEYQDTIKGTILLYPALIVTDAVHEQYRSKSDIPETTNFMGWINVGKNYFTDVWDLDIYKELSKDNKKILLIHGTSDSTVPISYSEKAYKTYKNSDFYKIEGAGHGFYGKGFDKVMKYIINYLNDIKVL